MFDLDMRVRAWREAQSLPADVVAELEEHLRSSVEDLAARELSPEEAFLVALRRLGSPSQLDAEFEKVPGIGAERRLRWLLAGVLVAVLLPLFVRVVARGSAAAALWAGAPEGALPWVVVAVGVLALVGATRRALTLSGGASERLSEFVEGRASGRRRRWSTAVWIFAAVFAVHVAQVTLSLGMTRVAPPSAAGWAAIGQQILGLLITLTLVIGTVVLLARRRAAPA